MKIGCVLLAAGNANRFHGKKLLAHFEGKPLLERALEAVPGDMLYKVAVITQDGETRTLAEESGYTVIVNDKPEEGVSRSIRLGMDALEDADAILFLVADQPLMRRESIQREIQLFQRNSDRIVAMGHGERRGNPALFSAALVPELRALRGDGGGRPLLLRPDCVLVQAGSERELYDIDTRDSVQ